LFYSGTTWVQEIVWQIFNEGQAKSTDLSEHVPFLERATHSRAEYAPPDIDAMPSPRIFKTYLSHNLISKAAVEDNNCKYIYVALNPKDVAVSYFEFLTSLERFKAPWEFYVKLFVEGNGKLNIYL